MEFITALADLHTGASCHCLDYFKEPVTTNCRHNFCLSCISMSWKDLSDTFPCPFCRHSSPERKFTNNPQLGNLIIAKLLQIRSKRKRKEEKLVWKNNQVLTFCCQKDLEVLCPQCSFSTHHRNHYIWPIEKAAPHHRKRLQNCIEPWKERIEQVEKVIITQSRKSLELKKVQCRREEIKSEFEQLLLFLKNEREIVLRQLQDGEMDILAKLNEKTFSNYLSTLKYLSKEIEGKYLKSELELLTDIKSIYCRWNLKVPEPFLSIKEYGYHLPPQYFGLKKIKSFQVDLILDCETAHRKLVISEDRKTVYGTKAHNLPRNPRRFYLSPAVLSSIGYNSGKQYWEVEVKDKPEWIMGVCKDSRRRKNQNQPVLVQDRLWGVGRCSLSNYIALGPRKINLLPKVIPTKIGIFLDCDLGEVFYNLSDKSIFLTIKQPYFYTGTDSKHLKICAVTDSE
ncbi:LOW QUALITY PROTEIN: putative tripartite motif-containing protein 61 [Lycaon pictus]